MKPGFTLIELLVAVGIIGVMTIAGLFSFDYLRKHARDSRRKADLAEIAGALERYYNANHLYPPPHQGQANCSFCVNDQKTDGTGLCGDEADRFTTHIAPFLSGALPTDPSYPPTSCGNYDQQYLYVADLNDRRWYKLYARVDLPGNRTVNESVGGRPAQDYYVLQGP